MYTSLRAVEHIVGVDYCYSDESIMRPTFFFSLGHSINAGSEFWDIISMLNGLFSVEDICFLAKLRYGYSRETIEKLLLEMEQWQMLQSKSEPSIWSEPVNSDSNMFMCEHYRVWLCNQDANSFDMGVLLSKYGFASLIYSQDFSVTSSMISESVFLDKNDLGRNISKIFAEKFSVLNISFSTDLVDTDDIIFVSNNRDLVNQASFAIGFVPENYKGKNICQQSVFSIKKATDDISEFSIAFNMHNDILLSILNGVYC